MHQPDAVRERPRRRSAIDDMLDRLQPALHGYPVKALVGMWADTPPAEAPAAGALVDLCLSSWIALLDVDTVTSDVADEARAMDLLRSRRRHTRDALSLVRERFRRSACEPGRSFRGAPGDQGPRV